MIRLICQVLAVAVLIVFHGTAVAQSTPAAVMADPYGPYPEECRIDPRPLAEVRALAAGPEPVATPLIVEATPGGELEFRTIALPEAPRADAAVAIAINETERQLIACANAGDFPRMLAAYSDNAIRGWPNLHRLANLAVAGEFSSSHEALPEGLWQQFPGLFHARLLPDGRVAAVAPMGFTGLLELHIFVREDDMWRLDEIAYLDSPDAGSRIAGNTLTTADRVMDIGRLHGGYGYGFGLEWGPAWSPLLETPTGIDWGTGLTNGVSTLVAGTPFRDEETGRPVGDFADCLDPLSGDATTDLRRFGLERAFFDTTSGLALDGTVLQGEDGTRAYVEIDVRYRPGGKGTASEPYRLYIECRAMGGGAWVLGIAHLAPAGDYDTEVVAREAVLATIEG